MESEWDKEPVSTPTLERREDPSPSKIMCVMGVGVGRQGWGSSYLMTSIIIIITFFFFFFKEEAAREEGEEDFSRRLEEMSTNWDWALPLF